MKPKLWSLVVLAVLLGLPASMDGQESSVLTFTAGAGQTATMSVDDGGIQTVTVLDSAGDDAFSVVASGYSGNASIDLGLGDDGVVSLLVSASSGSDVSADLSNLPIQADVNVTLVDNDSVTVQASDSSGDLISPSVLISGAGSSVGVSIAYDALPQERDAGRITPLFPGLVEENALGGSVTISASGLTVDSVVVVALEYSEGDVSSIDEAKLRVLRFANETGRYESVGSNDRGVGTPSMIPGDFGVDAESNTVWAVVASFGSFVAGVPDNTLSATIVEEGSDGGMTSTGICGAVGAVCFPLTMLTLLGMRRREWRER